MKQFTFIAAIFLCFILICSGLFNGAPPSSATEYYANKQDFDGLIKVVNAQGYIIEGMTNYISALQEKKLLPPPDEVLPKEEKK